MTQRRWACLESGKLELIGTDLFIIYDPRATGDWVIRQDDRVIRRCLVLKNAKEFAEARQDDLEEIGVG